MSEPVLMNGDGDDEREYHFDGACVPAGPCQWCRDARAKLAAVFERLEVGPVDSPREGASLAMLRGLYGE